MHLHVSVRPDQPLSSVPVSPVSPLCQTAIASPVLWLWCPPETSKLSIYIQLFEYFFLEINIFFSSGSVVLTAFLICISAPASIRSLTILYRFNLTASCSAVSPSFKKKKTFLKNFNWLIICMLCTTVFSSWIINLLPNLWH